MTQLSGAVIVGVVEGSEVTSTEYALTSWLNIVGDATPTELAHDLGLSPTTVSAMIDRLVGKKQIRRFRNPDDGRSYLLELTGAGTRTNARNGRRLDAAAKSLRGHLEGDPEQILAAMRLLEAALRKMLET